MEDTLVDPLLALEPADCAAAEAALRQALTVAKSRTATALVLRAVVTLARFLADQGRSEEARSLLRDELHGDVSTAEGPERHAAEAALAALG